MSKKARTLFFFVFALLLLVGGAAVYLSQNLDGIVAGLIEEHGSAATGTAVDVGGVSITLSSARGEISNLTVANPEGYGGGSALEFGGLSMELDAASVTSDPIVIEEITASDIRFNIEQRGGGNNLRELMSTLTEGGSSEESESAPRKVVIERFALSGASAEINIPDLGELRTVEVPDIVLTGIGRDSGGATAKQIATQVLEPVLRQAMESAAVQGVKDKVLDKVQEEGGDIARGLLDQLTGGDEDEQPEEQ